jgi:putative phosphoesterase
MVTKLLLISDTHLPKRAKVLPPEVWAAVEVADVVFHAGDWVDVALLEDLEARSARLVAVAGNNDGPELWARLGEIARVTIDGVRFAMIHETGASIGREARMDAAFPDTDVLVFGHSHSPWDTVAPSGMRLLNPGSPTDRRRQPAGTYRTASGDNGALVDVALHALPTSTNRSAPAVSA